MLTLIANSLVVIASAILVVSLRPLLRLVVQMPRGSVRRRWFMLTAINICFIFGYMGFIFLSWGDPGTWAALVAPAVFFLGGCFVYMTSSLALRTVESVRQITRLERESITDGLTGLYNRRYFDRRAEDEVARSRRYALPLALLLVDIDHFKAINDNHGHPAGDRVLRELSTIIGAAIRSCDIAARFGGEEFAILLPSSDLAAATTAAQRIRTAVESSRLRLADERSHPAPLRISVSIGVATLDLVAGDLEALVRDADGALYRAKADGRNRVCAKQPVVVDLLGDLAEPAQDIPAGAQPA